MPAPVHFGRGCGNNNNTNDQVVFYDWRNRKQRPSFPAVVVCSVILACSLAYAVAVGIAQTAGGTAGFGGALRGWGLERENASLGAGGRGDHGVLNWLDFLYFLSYIKVRLCTCAVLKWHDVVLGQERVLVALNCSRGHLVPLFCASRVV